MMHSAFHSMITSCNAGSTAIFSLNQTFMKTVPINSYALGMDALLEADKVKEYLFNMEHDLWEY